MESSVNKFSEQDIQKMEDLFSAKFTKSEDSYSVKINNTKLNSPISLEIINDVNDEKLVSVYTSNAHLQLQSCRHFIISEMLEEVIFVSEDEKSISGLIISKQGDCSLYSNVSKDVLRMDFMELNSEKLLSAVALSVTESVNQQ